ncbi:KGGVGR-motif variant AAA ATPase [Frankia sp. QA3]|uniref:KGGVGR-motif variant AAA ATPase n=1 Tax=Frankia sp. QA3 TaxID=710111 RepID=UPI000269CC72|nr:CobQ/CobB/MinD/ParA nucleotide binding domain-containing protein [Frankia sp. QA3]
MPNSGQEAADRIREAVLSRLRERDHLAQVQVAPDPFRGYRIRVVTRLFYGQILAERRSLAFGSILPDSEIAIIVLLTPDEAAASAADGMADLLRHEALELPLWPDSLARGQQEPIEVRLPSRSDDFLAEPLIATFYSLRGGVGRSTSLAYTALLLAREHRVLCLDMDLEAPGLAALFDVEREVEPGRGIVPLLLEAEIAGRAPDVTPHLLRVHPDRELYLLPAGHPDANYARQLAQLDPAAWYREENNPLRDLIAAVGRLRIAPQIVLIDARTGISPLSAPLLFDVADIAVITFFPHPQARVGTRALTRALLAARSERSYTPEPRFVVSPVPGAGAPEIRRRYEDRAADWIGEWLAPAVVEGGQAAFGEVEELIHVIGYSEDVAGTDSVVTETGIGAYAPISEWIKGFVPGSAAEEPGDPGASAALAPTSKSAALAELRFSAGTAEDQSEAEFKETFLQTETVGRATRADIPLILGRKGTGKTALFRRLATVGGNLVVTSPPRLPMRRPWMPSSETYKSVGAALAAGGDDWRVAWTLLIGVAIVLRGDDALPVPPAFGELACNAKDEPEYTALDLVEDVRRMLAIRDAGLVGWQWIRELDATMPHDTLLLFDGLDVGFGSTPGDLERRRDGVGGLLSLLSERADELVNLRMKILLREDIWRTVQLPNKSHLYGRYVRLSWADQTDYLKVVIKQALRAGEVAELMRQRMPDVGSERLSPAVVDSWPQSRVIDAWRVLVGERISGGKTAFTYNWVWRRLADSNGDHSPRSLVRLFDFAAGRERGWYSASPYERSLIRPRALVESLDDISDQEIVSLEEEFAELVPLFDALRAIGRTPFPARELQVESDVVDLGLEVGLLGIDSGSRDEAERYRVPELYRKALGMGRKGQA